MIENKEKINTFIFDYDGIFTNNQIWLFESGEQVRTGNTRDGFAVKRLIQEGYNVAIISGARGEGIRKRLEYIGVPPENIYLEVSDKLTVLVSIMAKLDIKSENVLYMGDDIPDIPVLEKVGVAVVPADVGFQPTVDMYRTAKKGGEGCVREVIEKFIKLDKTKDAKN